MYPLVFEQKLLSSRIASALNLRPDELFSFWIDATHFINA